MQDSGQVSPANSVSSLFNIRVSVTQFYVELEIYGVVK